MTITPANSTANVAPTQMQQPVFAPVKGDGDGDADDQAAAARSSPQQHVGTIIDRDV